MLQKILSPHEGTLVTESTAALRSTSRRTIWAWPDMEAVCRGVQLRCPLPNRPPARMATHQACHCLVPCAPDSEHIRHHTPARLFSFCHLSQLDFWKRLTDLEPVSIGGRQTPFVISMVGNIWFQHSPGKELMVLSD